jgi:hypothetical protein
MNSKGERITKTKTTKKNKLLSMMTLKMMKKMNTPIMP